MKKAPFERANKILFKYRVYTFCAKSYTKDHFKVIKGICFVLAILLYGVYQKMIDSILGMMAQ